MITSGFIPRISRWDQAKQPELDERKSIIQFLRIVSSLDPILRFLLESPYVRGTSSSSLTYGSYMC
ncbi:hypothetical protein YC2023_017841 [Brassica napus]